MIAGVGDQRCWVLGVGCWVLGGWSSSLISKIWRTVMNSEHWLVKYKICIITTAWRQRNSKHFLIWWFLANIFHFCKILWCDAWCDFFLCRHCLSRQQKRCRQRKSRFARKNLHFRREYWVNLWESTQYINWCYALRAFNQVPILFRRYIHYTELGRS
jgi:hypothetical protein